MDSFYPKLPFALAVLYLSINFGCGISEAQEEEIKIPDSPPSDNYYLTVRFYF
ncbi:MAG: hypothetical protein CM1200mP16_02340 [Nitrospina sp.]|nr:MAG: hypothetical protein CM1200mP16_02340 [Nitrospina sp.]